MKIAKPLSDVQLKTLEFIRKYIEKKNKVPSYSILCEKFGVSSGAISDRLRILQNKGAIKISGKGINRKIIIK